jgi:hypothetical protein
MRAVRRVLFSHSHPNQEFRLVLVAQDIWDQFYGTLNPPEQDDNDLITFESVPMRVDKLLPPGGIVYIPAEPKEDK